MRRSAVLGGVLAVVGVVAAAFGGDENSTTVTYRLEKPAGGKVTEDDVRTVIDVLERRLDREDIKGASIKASDVATITVSVWSDKPDARDAIRQLLERPGTLEFRICASKEDTEKWRGISEELGGPLVAPKQFAWVPFADGQPECLVLTPERPIAAKLEKARSEYAAGGTVIENLQAELDRTRREEVFSGDQLDTVRLDRQVRSTFVYFSFREDRKKAFSEFTERHVGQSLAIVLDGKVHSAPTIKSMLPGEGVIEGGGATGFTPSEARKLVTVLSCGALPVRLVPVEPEKK